MSNTSQPTSAGMAAYAGCSYCGLPIPGEWAMEPPAPAGGPENGASRRQHYCCSGCRLADAIQRERAQTGAAQRTLIQLGLAVFFTMQVMVFTMALWSHDVYPSVGGDSAVAWDELLRYASLLFSLPVLLLLGGPLCQSAWEGLLRRQIVVDQLLVLGVAVAFGYSMISIWCGDPHIYFEVGCVILVAVTIGRWLEATGRHRAAEAIDSLQRLLPDRVRKLGPQGEQWVALQDVQSEDRLRILPGERIPVDGVIESPVAIVDQQLVTGESLPTELQRGDQVHGGALNLASELIVHVTHPADDSLLRRLASLVRSAALSKGPQQQLADRLTQGFVPAVLVAALMAFGIHAPSRPFGEAWMIALSVVLIACPCALAIATPLAVWSALSHAALKGAAVRSGEVLDQLARAKIVFFDKTGTLTSGLPRLAGYHLAEGTDSGLAWTISQRLAGSSSHPLARALRDADAAERTGPLSAAETSWDLVHEHPGLGVWADDSRYGRCILGSLRLAVQHSLDVPPELQHACEAAARRAQPVVCVGWSGGIRALYWFEESIRDMVPQVLSDLIAMGLRTSLVTGDRSVRAQAFQASVPIDVFAELLPQEKLERIQQARLSVGPVVMVGDGINDAPSLAAADVGIALGTGADVSRAAASVCLLSDDLRMIPWLIRLAIRTRSTVRRNLFWAFSYNVIGIAIAMAGWLNPIVAALAMVGSSLLVIVESLRLAPPRSMGTSPPVPTEFEAVGVSEPVLAEGAWQMNDPRSKAFESGTSR